MSKKLDITGQTFGRLKVIEYAGQDKNKKTKWLCKCECGNFVVCLSNNLRKGNTKSCGCLQKEKTIDASTIHGMRKNRIYNIWSLMKNRCSDKNVKNYGGRGISVCDEWKNDFIAFCDWANKNGYADDLTIDRIDNNGNYEPSNCRWITPQEQSKNRRTNHIVICDGKKYLITEISKIIGCSRHTIARRLERGQEIKI